MSHGHSTRGEIRRLRELSRKWHSATSRQYPAAVFTQHEANLEQDAFLANFQIVRRVPDLFILNSAPASERELKTRVLPPAKAKCGKENKKPRLVNDKPRRLPASTSSDGSVEDLQRPLPGSRCKDARRSRPNLRSIRRVGSSRSNEVQSCLHRLSKIEPIISIFHSKISFPDTCQIAFNGITVSCAVCKCSRSSRIPLIPSKRLHADNVISANVDLGYKSDDGIIDLTLDDSF